MKFLLLDIPNALSEKWYYYHIFLITVILVFVIINMIIKKRSDLKEGQKNLKSAVNILKKIKTENSIKTKLKLATTRNLIRSAENYFNKCVKDNDMYSLTETINKIQTADVKIDNLIKKCNSESNGVNKDNINEIILLIN